jgi:hypothetical protein
MRRRKDRVRPEIVAEVEKSKASRRRAERELATTRDVVAHVATVTRELREFNEANGFGDWLVRMSVQGGA